MDGRKKGWVDGWLRLELGMGVAFVKHLKCWLLKTAKKKKKKIINGWAGQFPIKEKSM